MKRIISAILFLSFSQAQFAVSILDFKGEDVEDKVLRACYNQLEESLIESNRFTVIDKSQRDEILDEQKFQNSGMCDDECAVEIGQLVGAEYLMLGEIIGLGKLYQVNIKIINIEKGDVAEKVTNKIKGDLGDLLDGMEVASQEIVRRIASGSTSQQISPKNMSSEQNITITYGSLEVTSNPEGANILLDLIDYGVTPKSIPQIKTGMQNLILNYPGYERLQKRIMVSEGESVVVSEYLVPKTGSLSILSEPVGANVYLDNQMMGVTPLNLDGLNVKDYIIRLDLSDFQNIERRVTVQYNENTTQKYTLEPLPGKLSIFTSPSNAIIKVGGKTYSSNLSGIVTVDLSVGSYVLEISKEGYEPKKKNITVKPNDLGTLDINLKKLPAGVSSNPDMGFLTVNTLDSEIKLKIPGAREPQRLPLKYYELLYGEYNLKAFGSGLESEKRKISIGKQKTTTIEINLKRKQKSKAIKYSIMFPGGGQYYLGDANRYRGILYSAAFLGSAVLLKNSISNLNSENSLLDNYKSNYLSATSSENIEYTWDLYQKQSLIVNDVQTNLIIFSTALLSSWLSGILDSYFFSGLR